jgi:NAD(P)-dependent dehydrogenase (short-subunit alcohol dehydrogenase family)
VVFSECDVRDVPGLQAAIARSAEQLGPIRVLVNNAANDHRDKVAEMDQRLWDDRIAVNVRHHFFAAQAVAGMMRETGGRLDHQSRIDQCAHRPHGPSGLHHSQSGCGGPDADLGA